MKPTTAIRATRALIECTRAQISDMYDLSVIICSEFPEFEDEDMPTEDDFREWSTGLANCCTMEAGRIENWLTEYTEGDGFSTRDWATYAKYWSAFRSSLMCWKELVFFECDMDDDGSGFVTDMCTLSDTVDIVERALLALYHVFAELDI